MTPKSRKAVIGISGTGKSNVAKAHVAQAIKAGWEVVAVDPCDEWSQGGTKSNEITLGPLTQRATVSEFINDPVRWLNAKPLRLAIAPDDDSDEAEAALVDALPELIGMIRVRRRVLMVIEEVNVFTDPIEGTPEARSAISKLARRGRHFECPVLFVTQRAVDIPIGARSQLTELEVFAQSEGADSKALEERCGREFAERVEQLPAEGGQSLHWRLGQKTDSLPGEKTHAEQR